MSKYTAQEIIDFLDIDLTDLQSALIANESIVGMLRNLLQAYSKTDNKEFVNWYHDAGEKASNAMKSLYSIEAGAKAVYQRLCISVNENPIFDNLGLKLSIVTEINNNQEILKGLQYSVTVGESKRSRFYNVKDKGDTRYIGEDILNDLKEFWEKELYSVVENSEFRHSGYNRSWVREDFRCGTFPADEMRQSVETGKLTDGIAEKIRQTIYEYNLTPLHKATKEDYER